MIVRRVKRVFVQMTVTDSRNKCQLGRQLGGCLGGGSVSYVSYKASDRSSYSCPSFTRGTYNLIRTRAIGFTVLVYKAKVKVDVTTGGVVNVHTTLYNSRFSTRCAETRGGTGMLALKTEIVKRNLTRGVISVFLGDSFRNKERTEHVSGVARVREVGSYAGL